MNKLYVGLRKPSLRVIAGAAVGAVKLVEADGLVGAELGSWGRMGQMGYLWQMGHLG